MNIVSNLMSGLGASVLKGIETPFGIFSKDFHVLWINRSLARIHQVDPDEVIGEFCYFSFHGCDRVCENCFLETVRNEGKTIVLEKWHDFPSGKRRWGEVHAYPVRGEAHQVEAMVVIIFDTTSKKRDIEKLEKEIEQHKQQHTNTTLTEAESKTNFKLTAREKEILGLVVKGYTNPQISEVLSISLNTVKRHTSNIFDKLTVTDRTQAAVLATRFHLV